MGDRPIKSPQAFRINSFHRKTFDLSQRRAQERDIDLVIQQRGYLFCAGHLMQFQVNIRIALPEATGDGRQKLVGGGEDEDRFRRGQGVPLRHP